MHGAGNDFVVLDARQQGWPLSDAAVRQIADRHTGVGCDQVIVVEPARQPGADAFLTIRNADGSEAAACGNASRCIAWLLMDERRVDQVVLETRAGLLPASRAGERQVCVDMGPARLEWQDIPLAFSLATLHLPLRLGPLSDPVAVNMGNPHAVFFVDDALSIDLAVLGPRLEHDPLFPERCNIEVAQVIGRDRLRVRVWERGAGITRACGSGACATLVAAARRGLASRKGEIVLDGGTLAIVWRDDNHVTMTGPVALSFAGTLGDGLAS
jgi:diaminopimelate epimerase